MNAALTIVPGPNHLLLAGAYHGAKLLFDSARASTGWYVDYTRPLAQFDCTDYPAELTAYVAALVAAGLPLASPLHARGASPVLYRYEVHRDAPHFALPVYVPTEAEAAHTLAYYYGKHTDLVGKQRQPFPA